MKKIFIFMISISLLWGLTGCNSEPETIEGYWMAENGDTISFNNDGKAIIDGIALDYSVYNENNLSISFLGLAEEFRFDIEKDVLTLTELSSNSTMTYYRDENKQGEIIDNLNKMAIEQEEMQQELKAQEDYEKYVADLKDEIKSIDKEIPRIRGYISDNEGYIDESKGHIQGEKNSISELEKEISQLQYSTDETAQGDIEYLRGSQEYHYGNIEYYTCECGSIFKDKELTIKITKNDTVVNTTEHKYTATVTAPTCTEKGYTGDKKCECGDTITEKFPALGHVEQNLPEVLPTTTTTGLTAGIKCSRCNEILVKQIVIPAVGENITDNGIEGELYWAFDEFSGVLHIYGAGPMKDYEQDKNRGWNGFVDKIKTVIMHEGITTVGQRAFNACVNLENVSSVLCDNEGSPYRVITTNNEFIDIEEPFRKRLETAMRQFTQYYLMNI